MMVTQQVLIIAEAGVNHNGSVTLAKKLIDEAKSAGADWVKFQTFKAEKNISRHAPKAAYQKNHTEAGESQLEMVKKLELSEKEHLDLQAYCNEIGIGFLSTPFDLPSIALLQKMGITLGKIPSGEITNLPYLRAMAKAFPELIMSTGMATLDEVRVALDVLIYYGAAKEKIIILHCNTEYPTPMEDVNMRAMVTMEKELGVRVGYSDHTPGIEVPILAVALGAVVIEKHFTLDRNMEGPDHAASLNPAELHEMVRTVRNVTVALGRAEKQPSPSEAKNIVIARKSIVADKPIAKGERFTEENITMKRPGNGISPMHWDDILGKTASRDFMEDELISL